MNDRIRLAELLGSLSFAGDLGRGQPMGHVLRTCRIAMALADRLRLSATQKMDIYYISLLVHAGCTAGAADFASFIAGDELRAQKDFCLCDPNNMKQLFGWMGRNVAPGRPLPMKTLRILRLLAQGDGALREVDHGCSEVGSRIAARLGMSEETQRGLYQVCETWNGKGPHRLKGAEIPVAARLVNVAMIGEVFVSERGVAAAKEAAVSRSGSSFDPEIAEALAALGDEPAFWAAAESRDDWQDALDLEPQPQRYVTSSSLDEVALVFADIVDLKESGVVAHSRRTAELAEGTARRLRLPEDDVSLTRRAALVHDAGLVAVPTMILKKNGPLTAAEAERYRLHTYYTERILSHSHWLKPIGQVASAHHEATDGNGFHRGLSGNQLSMPARVLAVASAFAETMGGGDEQEPDLVLKTLAGERFDRDCLAALAAEVGVRGLAAHKPRDWPAGLTDREVEVLRQIAAGLSIRETADRLVVSNHTARHHVESIYSKLGVSSRAAAVLFAVENDLL